MRGDKKDANHNEIKQQLEKIPGCIVFDTHQLKKAFDCIVSYKGVSHIVEFKKVKAEKKYQTLSKEDKYLYLEKMLSAGEREAKAKFERAGVTYNIISCIEEALTMINAK